MLKRIKYQVTFPTTGKALAGEWDFENGLTTITGPNGAGKSMILELVRFALHGAKALRTVTAKYKGLSVELDFAVKGTDYRITRTLTKATLYRGTDALAVGTSPVNVKVTELFGYGLDVFDSSHCVNQGQIEALGSMKPAERKRMVDSVIGLNILDGLIKFAGDQAASFLKEAETYEAVATPPEPPAAPEGYRPSSEIDVKSLEALKSERDQILGQLKNEPTKPVRPDDCPVVETAELLERNRDTRADVQALLRESQAKHDAIPDPQYTAEQLDTIEQQIEGYDRWIFYSQKLAELPPKPSITMEELQRQKELVVAYAKWYGAKMVFDRHQIECPECHHTWHPDAIDPGPEPEKPMFASQDDWLQEKRRIEAWAKAPEPAPEVAEPPFGRHDLKWQRDALAKVKEKANLAADIKSLSEILKTMPDVTESLAVRRAYESAMLLYIQRKEAWEAFQELKLRLEARLAEIGDIDDELAQAQALYHAARLYEQQKQAYDRDLAKFQEVSGKAASARAKGEQYRRAKAALTTLKAMVKSHLVPSLSRVASVLVSQMTDGRFSCLQVDEEFDIKVDGQDLDELSGSEKSVANLAIRIGLGQVLTNRVFPVFMGDELDAAMDDERAGFTAECLRNLTGKIPQVILVTHKRPEADHYIELAA